MAEFEVNGHKYKTDTLDARKQFHVARRLAPVIGSFKGLLGVIEFDDTGKPTNLDSLDIEQVMEASEPFLQAISEMSDKDVDYIIDECLKKAQRMTGVDGKSWVNVWNSTAGRPQFDDIDMNELLNISWYVVTESLGGFFSILRSA